MDWDSEGLLLLSDDGAFNHALLDPRHAHSRTYLVQVENIPTEESLSALQSGLVIEGKKTLPAQANLVTDEPDVPARSTPIRVRKNIPTSWIQLSITEGRNRQVRRMTAAVGTPTLRLLRVSIGKLRLCDLKIAPGDWCGLSREQVMLAFE